jgi:putative endonuclease
MFFVYVLENKTGKYYIGQTNDILKRLQRHNSHRVKYTSFDSGSWKLVYKEEYATRSEAMRRETYLKNLKSKVQIKKLIYLNSDNNNI